MTSLPIVNYKKRAYITIEQKPNQGRFFIIVDGIAQVSKNHGFILDRKSAVLGPGDSFAITSCLADRNEIESVQAQSDLKVLVVERFQFGELVQSNKQIGQNIIRQFVTNIQMLNAAIANISLYGKVTWETQRKDSAPRLFRVGEFYQSASMFNQAYYAYYRCVQNYPDSPFCDMAKQEMEKIKSSVTQEKFDYQKTEFKRFYPKNAMLFAESEPGKELFFILRGVVKVSHIENNSEVTLAVLRSGDICGKISMLAGSPHTTNAVSIEDCHVLAIGPMGFDTVLKSRPQLLYRLSSKLAEQVWFLNKQTLNRCLEDPLVRLYDILAVMIEKERVTEEMYRFNFGIAELVDFAGYPQHGCETAIKRLLSENLIDLDNDGKIRVLNTADILHKNNASWKEPVLRPLD
jgi:CRP-like cAMP-binding protein